MTEIWKPIPGLEGFYEVSSLGRVKSVERRVWVSKSARSEGYLRNVRERILKPLRVMSRNKLGYPKFILWREHSSLHMSAHELVLTAFVGPRPKGMYGCHRDDCPDNNAVENLYWGTPKQNSADKIRHGNQPMGETIPWSKLTEDDVRRIREMAGSISQDKMAIMFGVQQSHISRIVNRREWRHVE